MALMPCVRRQVPRWRHAWGVGRAAGVVHKQGRLLEEPLGLAVGHRPSACARSNRVKLCAMPSSTPVARNSRERNAAPLSDVDSHEQRL